MLEARQTCLYHACQFDDFQAYLRLGGIPSRAYLEQQQEPFTPFETDPTDRENDVWDKVFVNLSDFGEVFAKGANCVPNPYGPIVLQIRPSALLSASDVAICLRSAGSQGFDRQKEALQAVSAVDGLFVHPASMEFPFSCHVKFAEQLREIEPTARNPEVSCSVEAGILPIENVVVAWVDPYELAGWPLVDRVREAMIKAGAEFKLHERSCRNGRRELYRELLSVVWPATMPLDEISNDATASESMRGWAENILAAELGYQFNRYAKYLREGTLQPLLGQPNGVAVGGKRL